MITISSQDTPNKSYLDVFDTSKDWNPTIESVEVLSFDEIIQSLRNIDIFYEFGFNNIFPNFKSFIDSLDYGYLRGNNIVKSRFKEACDEIGIKMPEEIKGYNYI
jgi:hypothetical protein